MSEKKKHCFAVPVNTVRGTNFSEIRPEHGELLAWDYYANGSITGVVRVTRVTKSFFYLEDGRKVERLTGKAVGFETAVVRRDPACKKHYRQACERRLMYFEYGKLPGKVIREMNRILDDYEVEASEMKRKYMLSLQDPGKQTNFRGKHTASKHNAPAVSENTSTKKSVLDDAKPSWGRKRRTEDD